MIKTITDWRSRPTPPIERAWEKIDPALDAVRLALLMRRIADCVGLFSLFALVAVFSGIAGDKVMTWSIDRLGPYEGLDWRIHVPWLPFMLAGAIGVWLFNRHGLRVLLALKGWRVKGREPTDAPVTKLAILVAMIAFAALIIVTATHFQDAGRVDDARAAAITEQTAARDRAAVQAELSRVTRDLETLTQPADDTPNLQTQAARATATGWASRVVAARAAGNEPLALRLEAEIATARAADTLRDREAALNAELAQAPVEAATAATVDVDRGATAAVVGAFASMPVAFAVATEFLAILAKLAEILLLRRAQASFAARPVAQPPPQPAASPKPLLREATADHFRLWPDQIPQAGPPLPPETAPEPERGKRRTKPLPAPTVAELAALKGEPVSEATQEEELV
jgi:hypothetical protein